MKGRFQVSGIQCSGRTACGESVLGSSVQQGPPAATVFRGSVFSVQEELTPCLDRRLFRDLAKIVVRLSVASRHGVIRFSSIGCPASAGSMRQIEVGSRYTLDASRSESRNRNRHTEPLTWFDSPGLRSATNLNTEHRTLEHTLARGVQPRLLTHLVTLDRVSGQKPPEPSHDASSRRWQVSGFRCQWFCWTLEVERSMLDVHLFQVSFSVKLAAPAARGGAEL